MATHGFGTLILLLHPVLPAHEHHAEIRSFMFSSDQSQFPPLMPLEESSHPLKTQSEQDGWISRMARDPRRVGGGVAASCAIGSRWGELNASALAGFVGLLLF